MSDDKKIRKRESYRLFKRLADQWSNFVSLKVLETMLGDVYSVLNNKRAWGSQTQAYYAKESLTLLMADLKR